MTACGGGGGGGGGGGHVLQVEIDSVILMGGGTRVPRIQEALLKAVNKYVHSVCVCVCVCVCACIIVCVCVCVCACIIVCVCVCVCACIIVCVCECVCERYLLSSLSAAGQTWVAVLTQTKQLLWEQSTRQPGRPSSSGSKSSSSRMPMSSQFQSVSTRAAILSSIHTLWPYFGYIMHTLF